MRVIFAPDWRSGVPYQRLLADALETRGVHVEFLQNYRRILPLTRLLHGRSFDLLHLHWPEAYYPSKGDGLDLLRCARFSTDLALATRDRRLAVTAHNLHAHNRAAESFAHHNTRVAFLRAGVVFAHSAAAKGRIANRFAIPPERITVVPHGDLSTTLGDPLPAEEARRELDLADGPVVLMFGAVEPYKGIEDAIAHWRKFSPAARLCVVGRPITEEYGRSIQGCADGLPNVEIRLGWLDDRDLRVWLSAVDAVLFNYREIFTSGAACLARSFGVPLLLPSRNDTVDLAEPNPRVFRFEHLESDFTAKLAAAIPVGRNYAAAAEWRESTAWSHVAQVTADAYLEIADSNRRAS